MRVWSIGHSTYDDCGSETMVEATHTFGMPNIQRRACEVEGTLVISITCGERERDTAPCALHAARARHTVDRWCLGAKHLSLCSQDISAKFSHGEYEYTRFISFIRRWRRLVRQRATPREHTYRGQVTSEAQRPAITPPPTLEIDLCSVKWRACRSTCTLAISTIDLTPQKRES